MFNCTNQAQTVNLRSLALTCGGAGSQTAITLNQSFPLGTFETSVFFNVTFRGNSNSGATYWGTCGLIENYSATSWESVTCLGGSAEGGGVGIAFNGSGQGGTDGPNFSIYHNIAKCIFNSLAIGISYGSFAQGITVTQSNFQNTQYGIVAPLSAAGTGQSQLNVDNNQFFCFNTAILLQTGVSNVAISGNDFIVNNKANANAISVTGSSYGTVYGNNVNALGANSTFGIVLQNCSNWNISCNLVNGFSLGVLLLGTTNNSIVATNTYVGCTSNATDDSSSSTNQIIFDNQSTLANLAVGPSPWTYTAGSSPEVIYLFNGAIDNVSKSGVFVATATNATVHLKPHESLVVTYSSAPNASREKM